MQCKEVQSKFIPFINDELNHKELKEFLAHIRQCIREAEDYLFQYKILQAEKIILFVVLCIGLVLLL